MYDSIKQKGKRKRLVEKLVSKGIKDKRVLEAILNIPRHFFMDKDFQDYAYDDKAFPISNNQTISQPYTVVFVGELEDNDSTLHTLSDERNAHDNYFTKQTTDNTYLINAGSDLSGTTSATAGDWAYGIYVADGSSSKIRINGTAVASGDAGSNAYNPLTMGSENDNTDHWSKKIMHFIIYEKALSDAEITHIEAWCKNEAGI